MGRTMDADAIRILEVPNEDIHQANVSNFVRVFAEIAQNPHNAKQLRGKIVVGFAIYDSDPRPNWAIPEIRAFIQALDREFPHFSYFLFGDPATEHLLFYLLCLTPLDVGADGPGYHADNLLYVAAERMEKVASFCERIGDEQELATNPILLNLPVEVLRLVPDLQWKVFEAMGPTLRALEMNTAPELSTEQGKEFTSRVLSKASALSGVDPSQYPSQKLLIQELSTHANKVTPEEVNRFEKSFDECCEIAGNGKLRISTVRLRQVVRKQRRAACQFIESHMLLAAAQPGYLQPASIVAAALMAEFNDSGPMRRIEERAQELGAPPELWMPRMNES
jgi:hypothetical protein